MGAGSSTEQRSPEQPPAGSDAPAAEPEPQPRGGSPSAEEAPGPAADPAIAAADPATKLLQKNGQLSALNGLAEQAELSLQEEALDDQEEAVIVTDVGQRESEDVREKDSGKEMAANSTVVEDITKDGQEDAPEILEQIPPSESNLEELTQAPESQASDVGFKKVFKFVGFKFTVKKDKTEKSDTVQLLTVKKDEGEGAGGSNGAGDHQEPSAEPGEVGPKESELKQSTEPPEDALEPSNPEMPLQAESGQAAEEGKAEGEEKQEKEPPKSPESPTSPVASETASPFKKFFTQGWAGWRKKTSFRKPKEEELEASEKPKEQEPEKADTEDNEKTEDTSEHPVAPAQPHPQGPAEGGDEARLSADYEKVELPTEDLVSGLQGASEEKCAPLATEVFDEKIEVHQEVIAEVHVSTTDEKTKEEQEADVEEDAESSPPEKLVEAGAEPAEELAKNKDDQPQPAEASPDEKAPSKHPEGIVSEAELLSSQERIKVQGSPLKKLFSSSGLKKLSGKKQKGKRGGDEEVGEPAQLPAESPDSADEQKGESSASSPDEPEEVMGLEKGVAEGHQEAEAEEGATSDGEKKREGVTPWASFKKMVTPKKRVRRLSESDKEDELDKVKSATLSSTESAASEMQEDIKGTGEEQRPEEPKRKVDTSVSWEALICVGSSKKRARKASSSDEEGGPKATGADGHKAEEAGKDKDTGPDAILASAQDQDQVQGSSSPEPAGSPSEGEGVSTWESFKRLVTPRKKSKSKLEEKSEDPGVEHSVSDVEPGKEESWVSIKKFIPGRRKKRPDGKHEQATVEGTGPMEVNEDDPDVPAVVPLSEYDAVEREKMEAQQAPRGGEEPEQQVATCASEELGENLPHTAPVTAVDGLRAVSDVEERSPSWISASVTEPAEQAEEEAAPLTGEAVDREVIAEETPVATQAPPESGEARDDAAASEAGFPPEAVTAAETAETTETLGAEEGTEASGAEETTEMVSAVSQLTDSPDSTEEATPVQEVEGDVLDTEDQERRTRAVLQAVAEKVKGEPQPADASGPDGGTQAGQEAEPRAPGRAEEEAEEESEVLGLRKEMDVESKAHGQETDASMVMQTIPESFETAQATASVTTFHSETVAGVKSQESTAEEALPPDSADTLTDSETNGSTPVADVDGLSATQQDEVADSQEHDVVSGPQSQVTEAEAVAAPKEGPPPPPSLQPQEESEDRSKMEEVLEGTDQEVSVDAVPVLSKAEVTPAASPLAEGEAEGGPCVEGPQLSTPTDKSSGQEPGTEVILTGEVTEGAEGQENERQSPSPEDSAAVAQVEGERTEAERMQDSEGKLEQETAAPVREEPSQPLAPTATGPVSPGSPEGSAPPGLEQKAAGGSEIRGQGSEASVAVEEKALGETVKIPETGGTLEGAGAQLVPAEKAAEEGGDWTPGPGDGAVPVGPASLAESVPATERATSEGGLAGQESAAQEGKSGEGDEQVGGQGCKARPAREEDLKGDGETVQLETESSKLIQNIIQTAVDQFARTEETATERATAESHTQAPLVHADSHGAAQKPQKEERGLPVSAQGDTPTVPAPEDSEPTAVGPPCSDVSQEVNEASEKMVMVEVQGSSLSHQPLEEGVLLCEAEGDGTESKPAAHADRPESGERTEKAPLESKDKEKGDAARCLESQNSALAAADASGGLTREAPDANGPKLREDGAQEAGFQEGKVHSEPEKEIKAHTGGEIQSPESELAEPGRTEP